LKRALDLVWLAALMAFVVIGTPNVSFHGDESMQLYMSRDYWIAFVYRAPDELPVTPPYPIDSDAQLRILNGSTNRYLIGAAWHAAGYSDADLPPRPGWDWGLSYADNVATGHRPTAIQMFIARLPSAILFALSIPVIFALGSQIGGRRLAWIAAGAYALHPVLLLQGRRATQEGAMLFFGLMCIWIAAHLTRSAAPRRSLHTIPLYLALAAAGGVALASKHSAAVFVIGAWAWVLVATLTPLTRIAARRIAATGAALGVTAALTCGLFIALSPALWRDPAVRIGDLLAERARVIDIQVAISGGVPLTIPERIAFLIEQPFLAAVQHFELESWRAAAPIQDEIARYMESLWSGVNTTGGIAGVALTLCMGIGLIILLDRAIRANRTMQPRLTFAPVGLLAWTGIAALSILANPLDWQRYALTWLPAAILLTALGIDAIIARLTLSLSKRRSSLLT
jgi:4-amino-4-deoxy-L-arabinose transferase-like glycosyltransferase